MTSMCRHTIGIACAVGLTVVTTTAVTPANASMRGQPEDPDWPCVQRLVPEIAPGMIWTGPPIDSVDRSDLDPRTEELAAELAARRVPLDDARERADAFAQELDPADKDDELTRLFAETLAIINRDRASIISGIKRFARKQRGLSDEIEGLDAALRELPADGSGEQPARRAELEEQRDWSVRLFDERESSLTYLCEQPVLLEQRAFALARALAGHLH